MAEKAPWETEEEIAPWDQPEQPELPKKEDESFLGLSKEGLVRGALEAAPTIGMIAGGIGGTALGPWGTVGGAGLGAAAGKSLEQAGKAYLFNEGPKTIGEQYKELGKEALYGAASEAGGQVVGKAIGKIVETVPKVATKVSSALTGVSETEISTFANRADKIKQLAKETDKNVMEAADQIRAQFNQDIGNKISSLNKDIGDVLSSSTKRVKSEPIFDALESYKSKLNPKLNIEDLAQISELQNRILNATQGGEISVLEANQIKQFLQDKAKTAYSNGEMFQIGKEAANAAKSGAATARKLIDEVEPGVTKLNSYLQRFHNIEDTMNQNLLKVGGAESALMSAGTGGNIRNVKALQELGELTGTNMLEQAQNLAAMRTFTNPSIVPVDTTGKSLTRLAVGAGLGAATGGGTAAVAAGSALTSPWVLTKGIGAMRAVSPVIKAITPSEPTRDIIYKTLLQKYFESPSGEVKEVPQQKPPDQSSILDKVKGSPYEKVLQNALQSGGDRSFAAANYVLKSRDPNYRKLFEEV